MTADQAGEILKYIKAAYPRMATDGRYCLSTESEVLIVRHLRVLPFESSQQGVMKLVATSKFVPTLSEIVEACGVVDEDVVEGMVTAILGGGQLMRGYIPGKGGPWHLVLPGGVEPIPYDQLSTELPPPKEYPMLPANSTVKNRQSGRRYPWRPVESDPAEAEVARAGLEAYVSEPIDEDFKNWPKDQQDAYSMELIRKKNVRFGKVTRLDENG